MSGEITIKKGSEEPTRRRPSWRHSRPADKEWPGDAEAQLEMTESCRNVLEQIANSQMLQCEVARDIRRLRLAMERIDKRLAKIRKLR